MKYNAVLPVDYYHVIHKLKYKVYELGIQRHTRYPNRKTIIVATALT